MPAQKILIATTNIGKFNEFASNYADLHLNLVNLKDLGLHKIDLEEPYKTTWENALHKAKFFGDMSGLLTIAEDTGIFVKKLGGGPGVKSKRFGQTAEERNAKILKLLKSAKGKNRSAYFETSGCLYEPQSGTFHMFRGRAEGLVTAKCVGCHREGMGYDSILYYPPLKKTFAEMSIEEKNTVSHRGKVIGQIKGFLIRQISLKQFVAPAAIIVKDRKMLMTLRRDTRPEFNNKWEFPGGGVDNGEDVLDCLHREIKEETGYKIEVLEQLPEILSVYRKPEQGNYKIFLILFICKIKSGKFKPADAETAGHGWFSFKQMLKANMLSSNKKFIQTPKNLKVLKKYID